MNETTDKLLRDLAEKLGTTVEHLWSVLVKQAGINSLLCSIYIAITASILIKLYYVAKSLTTAPPVTEDDPYPQAQWRGDDAFFVWAMFGVAIVISLSLIALLLHSSITGLLNPEYWALKQILK